MSPFFVVLKIGKLLGQFAGSMQDGVLNEIIYCI